jgi:hypothetical protein
MNRNDLRRMILAECGCMAREGQLPNAFAAAMPMLDILGYGGDEDGAPPTVKRGGGMSFEDSNVREESSMIKNNLYNIASNAQDLHDALEDEDDLPEWVQEKIAVAEAMIDAVYDYLHAETARSGMHEARKAWYMKKRRNMKKTNESEWYDIPKPVKGKRSKKK